MSDELRVRPVCRIGHRPIMFLGGDRDVIGMSAIAGATMAIFGGSWQGRVLGALLVLGGLAWARALVKRDPFWLPIYRRRMTYRNAYPARSAPQAQLKPRRPWR